MPIVPLAIAIFATVFTIQHLTKRTSKKSGGSESASDSHEHSMIRTIPEELSGNYNKSKAQTLIATTVLFCLTFFVTAFVLGNLWVARNLLQTNADFNESNVEIVALGTYETSPERISSSKGRAAFGDLSSEQIAKLEKQAVALGRKINANYIGVYIVNDLCSLSDSDSTCESRMTYFNDQVLDKKLGFDRYDQEGLIITMDIQDNPPFTWMTSHGRTADQFFSSDAKNRIFAYAKSNVLTSVDANTFVYLRIEALFDGIEYELRGFGTLNPSLMITFALAAIIVAWLIIQGVRKRYGMHQVDIYIHDQKRVTISLGKADKTATGTHTERRYSPVSSSSSSSGSSGSSSSGGGGSSSGGGRG